MKVKCDRKKKNLLTHKSNVTQPILGFIEHPNPSLGVDPGGRGGGGVFGVRPFWGTPKLHKEGKNVRAYA